MFSSGQQQADMMMTWVMYLLTVWQKLYIVYFMIFITKPSKTYFDLRNNNKLYYDMLLFFF